MQVRFCLSWHTGTAEAAGTGTSSACQLGHWLQTTNTTPTMLPIEHSFCPTQRGWGQLEEPPTSPPSPSKPGGAQAGQPAHTLPTPPARELVAVRAVGGSACDRARGRGRKGRITARNLATTTREWAQRKAGDRSKQGYVQAVTQQTPETHRQHLRRALGRDTDTRAPRLPLPTPGNEPCRVWHHRQHRDTTCKAPGSSPAPGDGRRQENAEYQGLYLPPPAPAACSRTRTEGPPPPRTCTR